MALTTTLEQTPWVHLVYLFTDSTARCLGHNKIVLVCLKCGDYEVVEHDLRKKDIALDSGDPLLRVVRDNFESCHSSCNLSDN